MEGFDQGGAAREDGALVDVALVGDLPGIDARRLGEDQRPCNPVATSRVFVVVGPEQIAEALAQRGVGAEGTRGHRGERGLARGRAREDEEAEGVAIEAGDDRVLHERRGGGDELRSRLPDVDPRPGGELEVLGDPPIEDDPSLGRVGVAELGRVAGAEVALVVEGERSVRI